MIIQVHAEFNEGHALGLKKSALQGGVRLRREDPAAFADDAVPGNALAIGRGGHRAAGCARAAGQAQKSSERPIR